MRNVDEETPLNKVRLLLDNRSYFMPISSHEKFDRANESRLVHSIEHTLNDSDDDTLKLQT